MKKLFTAWNPAPVSTGCFKNMVQYINRGAWVPESKYFIKLHYLLQLPHLSSFKNGLSDPSIIISSHFMSKNIFSSLKTFSSRKRYAVAWQRNLAKITAILEIYNIETIKIKEKRNTKLTYI